MSSLRLRFVAVVCVAALGALALAIGSAAQERPPGPPPQDTQSGPVTTVSWVGDTIFVRGGDEPNHIEIVLMTAFEGGDQRLLIQPMCTFADQKRVEQEFDANEDASPPPCERRGRIVVDPSAKGPDDSSFCRNGAICEDVTSANFKQLVVETGGGNDEFRLGYMNREADYNLGDGNDEFRMTFQAALDDDDLHAGPGDDRIIGNGHGDEGGDYLEGGAGDGGPGADRLVMTGRLGDMRGGAGNDRLTMGRRGSGQLDGGSGNDILIGGGGTDYLFGGPGRRDRCDGKGPNPRNRRSRGWVDRDRASGCEILKNVP